MIASIKMIFVDDPKAKKLLSEAVYVTTDTVDPANDGKAVIVWAPKNKNSNSSTLTL